jgi:ribosomal protein S20
VLQQIEKQQRPDEITSQEQTEMKTSIERIQVSIEQLGTEQMQLHNQSFAQMDNILVKIQPELSIETNKNVEALLSDVQQLNEIHQRSEEMALEIHADIKTAIEQVQESNNQFQTSSKQSFEELNSKFDQLQSEMISRTEQANREFETLQADVQRLVEAQQRSDKMALEDRAERVSLKAQVSEIGNTLDQIHKLLMVKNANDADDKS